MTEIERSHAELRAALILAGREILKLNFGRKNNLNPRRLRAVLCDARAVAKSQAPLNNAQPSDQSTIPVAERA